MHIKRFEAPTIEEALEQVRATLGPDALILSSRTLARGRGAFGLLSRPVVEVQAAIERGSLPLGAPSSAHALDAASPERALEAQRLREAFEDEVRSGLRGLRAALARLGANGAAAPDDPVARRLAAAGVDPAHVRSLWEEARTEAEEGGSRPIERLLFERIDARLAPPRFDPKRRVRVLVGAPGVGKTTTLAKLAGRSEEAERDVSFVSLDPFRVGARAQLRAYAELLGAPYNEVGSAREVAELAGRRRDEAILVDTAGRSPGDLARQAPLECLREALGERASIELVIDATVRSEVAREQLGRFARLAPDRLILTKLDECDSLAPVVNLLLDERCPPVCWLGTGQRVPEDLELAEPARFARSVLGRAA